MTLRILIVEDEASNAAAYKAALTGDGRRQGFAPLHLVALRLKAIAAVLLLAACSVAVATPTPLPSLVASPTPTPTLTPTPNPTLVESPTPTPGATSRGPLVLMAVGDIACDPADPSFHAGAGTATLCRQRDTARLLAGADLILVLGDNQYECGGLAAYRASFNLSWGAYKARIRPALGNHEHIPRGQRKQAATNCDPTGSAAGYFAYFGSAAPAGAYSFDAGGWHFATVDSTCSLASCAAEASWLSRDLAAHPTACSIVFYHHPRFSSGEQGSHVQSAPFWRVAAAAGVDIILNGHDHDYERFAPMDANGTASATGMREFVVGTGGRNLTPFRSFLPNSQAHLAFTFGVLKLTLRATSYAWQFVPIAGQTFTDRGTGICH